MSKPTYSEYASIYAEKYNSNPNRMRDVYSSQKNHVFQFFGSSPVDTITTEQVLQIPEKMRREFMNETSISVVCRHMNRIFNLAIDNGDIDCNPCALQFMWNSGSKCRYPASLEDHNLLVRSIEKLPYRNIVGFSYMTGLSFLQLKNIHNADVNTINNTFYMNTTKLKGLVHVPNRALPYFYSQVEINRLIGETENDLFFVTDKGKHIPRVDLNLNSHILRSLVGNPTLSIGDLWRAYPLMLNLTEGRMFYDFGFQHGSRVSAVLEQP